MDVGGIESVEICFVGNVVFLLWYARGECR